MTVVLQRLYWLLALFWSGHAGCICIIVYMLSRKTWYFFSINVVHRTANVNPQNSEAPPTPPLQPHWLALTPHRSSCWVDPLWTRGRERERARERAACDDSWERSSARWPCQTPTVPSKHSLHRCDSQRQVYCGEMDIWSLDSELQRMSWIA